MVKLGLRKKKDYERFGKALCFVALSMGRGDGCIKLKD